MSSAVQVIALLLLVFGGMLLFAAYRLRQLIHPPGHVDYVDDEVEIYIPHGPLIHGEHRLAARPDGIFRFLTEKHAVPYYIIDHPAPDVVAPPLRLLVGLACLLTEDVYDQTIPYGLLRYTDRDIVVNWTPGLSRELEDVLSLMREDTSEKQVDRSHQDPTICAYCVVRDYCDQVLE